MHLKKLSSLKDNIYNFKVNFTLWAQKFRYVIHKPQDWMVSSFISRAKIISRIDTWNKNWIYRGVLFFYGGGREEYIYIYPSCLFLKSKISSYIIGAVQMVPYLSSLCMYAKLANLALFFYSDPRLGIVYSVLCLSK